MRLRSPFNRLLKSFVLNDVSHSFFMQKRPPENNSKCSVGKADALCSDDADRKQASTITQVLPLISDAYCFHISDFYIFNYVCVIPNMQSIPNLRVRSTCPAEGRWFPLISYPLIFFIGLPSY